MKWQHHSYDSAMSNAHVHQIHTYAKVTKPISQVCLEQKAGSSF